MNMESGVAEILSVVYAVYVMSPFASDRRDRLVAATTPTPCRNGSWGEKKNNMRKLSPVKHVMFLISSFNIKHSNNKIRITYTDWATVCGRMSLMPRCRPSFRLSEITSTGRLGAGSTSKSSSSSSSSSVILQYVNITVFTLRIRGYSTHTVPTTTTECKTNPLWIMRAAILGNKQANILIQFIYG